jgi:phage shock protein PspC (stress-responsive transcriptional regulator)
MNKRLTKGRDTMISGVCSGLSEYFNFDVTIIRLLCLLLIFSKGFGLMLYIILAIIMPEKE